MENVLETIKKLIGFGPEYGAFDVDLIININAALDTLKQLGVKVKRHLAVEGNEIWEEIFEDPESIDMMKNYIYLKCRLVFDPPMNASILESIKETIKEYEYRLNLEIEYNEGTQTNSGEEVDAING